jgi:hypothetical protein
VWRIQEVLQKNMKMPAKLLLMTQMIRKRVKFCKEYYVPQLDPSAMGEHNVSHGPTFRLAKLQGFESRRSSG